MTISDAKPEPCSDGICTYARVVTVPSKYFDVPTNPWIYSDKVQQPLHMQFRENDSIRQGRSTATQGFLGQSSGIGTQINPLDAE